MRFTSAIVAGVFAVAASAQSTTVPAEPSSTWSLDPVQSSIAVCLDTCDIDDVDCKARCNPVPNPSVEQVNATTECVAACEQGNGTEADTAAYIKCQGDCFSKNFYDSNGGTPKVGGNSNSGNSPDTTGSASNPEETDTEEEVVTEVVTESGVVVTKTTTNTAATGTQTDASATTDSGSNALAGSVLFGAVAVVLAL